MPKRIRPDEQFRQIVLNRARDLRSHMSPAEVQLWSHLRGDQLHALRFRRQYRIGTYIVDFYCDSRKLIIEVDGNSHDERQDYDDCRTEYLNQCALPVIRFTNSDIASNLDGVLLAILDACNGEDASPQPSPRVRGEGAKEFRDPH